MGVTFVTWLDAELEKRRWTRQRLADLAGISHASLSHYYTGKRNPGFEVCKAISKALNIPLDTVLIEAKLKDPPPSYDPIEEELKFIFYHMTGEQRELYLATGRLTVELEEERKRGKNER